MSKKINISITKKNFTNKLGPLKTFQMNFVQAIIQDSKQVIQTKKQTLMPSNH